MSSSPGRPWLWAQHRRAWRGRLLWGGSARARPSPTAPTTPQGQRRRGHCSLLPGTGTPRGNEPFRNRLREMVRPPGGAGLPSCPRCARTGLCPPGAGPPQPSRDRARPSRRAPSLSAGGRRRPGFPGSRAVGGDPAFSSGRRSVSAEADDGPRWGGRRCPGRGAGAGPLPQPAGRGPGAAGAVSPAAGPGRGGGVWVRNLPGGSPWGPPAGGKGRLLGADPCPEPITHRC